MSASPGRVGTWGFLLVAGVAGALLAWHFHGGDARDERARAEAERQQALADAPEWYREGEQVYSNQCAACHSPDGHGAGRNFPPLAGHIPELLAAEGGREYLIDVMLYGIGGEIRVLGETYRGQMPGFGRISDAEIAAMLNYIAHAWGNEEALPENFPRYEAGEVGERRDQGLRPRQMNDRRPQLDPP